jgi:protein KTI12
VHVAAQEDECTQWNRERLRAWDREEKEDGSVEKQESGKQGMNILGDLAPESHTAIYGDRVVGGRQQQQSKSRSSSLDGLDADERPRPDDTMTLKSLYIGDRAQTDTRNNNDDDGPVSSTTANSSTNDSTPSSTLPHPSPASSPPYSPSTLSSLLMRYEPPSPFSRWDTPLFTIPSTDATPPSAQIWSALFPTPVTPTSKKALSQLPASIRNTNTNSLPQENTNTIKPHAATILPTATSSSALQTLESATMDVVKTLLSASRDPTNSNSNSSDGDILLSIPSSPSSSGGGGGTIVTNIHIPPGTVLNQPMLQRLRRKYTQIQRGGIAHGQGYVQGRRAVVEGFVAFLDRELNSEVGG